MDFEQRIQNAADEVRQVTRAVRPPEPRKGPRVTPAGWLAFAVAFGAVVLAIGVLPSLLGSDDPGPLGTSDTTSPIVTPTTVQEVPSTVSPLECSSAMPDDMARHLDTEGATRQVADVWLGIVQAAEVCDFEALVDLAGPDFTTNFGGGGAEMFEEWENSGEGKMDILLAVLSANYAIQEFEGDAEEALGSSVLYVWPAAFARDTWEEITAEEMADLLTIYTQEELDQLAGFGSYAGWRTGITQEGDWVFFVAGD
ncbi:MAG: hypothetical protein WD269_07200 [Acidimicrobiia bacterium]